MCSMIKIFDKVKTSKLTYDILKRIYDPTAVIKRSCCNSENHGDPQVQVERLKTRSLLSVEGLDSLDFLQELTTNDVNKLDESAKCIFTAFLNAKGKVIHDTIIYKPQNSEQYLVECDIQSLEALKIHLTMYRGKKKVEVKSIEEEMNVWAIYSSNEETINEIELGENVIVCTDPRLSYLGLRVLAPASLDVAKEVSGEGVQNPLVSSYKSLRYKLGIGEGAKEIPYGRYSPWEVNCDYMNGISSKKNSYIGQEEALRLEKGIKKKKRLMPIFLELFKMNVFPLNTPIEDVRRKKRYPLGYLRGNQGGLGLGLMDVNEVQIERSVRIGQVLGQCVLPPWWPQKNTALQILNKS